MIVTVISKGKPYVYNSFHAAKEKACIGDTIYEGENEYIVPDYKKMYDLECRIRGLGKFSTQRKNLILRLANMTKNAIKFEERIKNDWGAKKSIPICGWL